jgi:Homeodomain-like domain
MLVELRVGEQRYRAVWEVLEGASVIEVARRFKVSRQSVHAWLTGMPQTVAWAVWVIGRRGRIAVRIR